MSQAKEMIEIKAGEKLELFSRSFSSVPMNYEFSAEPTGPGGLKGTLEVHRKKSLAKKSVSATQLNHHNSVRASMWDTFVSIYVIAESDLTVSLPKRKLGSLRMVLGLVMVTVALAAIIIVQQSQ